MRPSSRRTHVLVAVLAILGSSVARGQGTPGVQRLAASDTISTQVDPVTSGVVLVSGDSVDQLRIAELMGTASTEGLMLRSTSSLTDPRRHGITPRLFTIVMPHFYYVDNSNLPFGQNDGALWAGAGANARVLGGFTVSAGPIRLVAIPEFAYSANNRLSINPVDPRFVPQPNLILGRDHFSSPWNQFPYSIDMPWRFGDSAINRIYPGQSSLTVTLGPAEFGAATENEWWGPAIRNPVVMSDNAAGFPHGFIRTSHPVNTFLGRFDARWIWGSLEESKYFDVSTDDDERSLSALAITWKRSQQSGLTLGFTRSVITSLTDGSSAYGHFFDALKNVGHPDALSTSDHTMTPGSDQLFSLFARWVLPVYGVESYIEWGRADFPISVRDMLEQPDHSRAYTAGLQWAKALGPDSKLRVQGEATNEEQSTTYRFRANGSFYTSRSVIQGFTNNGQIIGSGIGPGSSAQWIAADYYKGGWTGGLSLGRQRFNNDAYFLLPFELSFANQCAHDVSLYPGIRGGYSNSYFRFRIDYQHVNRYNTFFQNKVSCAAGGDGSDRVNRNLQVTLSTFGW
ncbi:MAG TPA: capsule assembly Wzi family protein [Gemmatimonadaceae bacterium]|nr:capsule assembly Wzi family protein [Gemmatimonadaceae bacterium]